MSERICQQGDAPPLRLFNLIVGTYAFTFSFAGRAHTASPNGGIQQDAFVAAVYVAKFDRVHGKPLWSRGFSASGPDTGSPGLEDASSPAAMNLIEPIALVGALTGAVVGALLCWPIHPLLGAVGAVAVSWAAWWPCPCFCSCSWSSSPP
ncbi:hypothetical protein POL68_17955 [Stigmatella sp. ncwal1]|uniref:Uncharacterized protein n=1 Tax=Stigmatella ashevillensis TaxID=2995309 RepID=A0ABT5D9N7_9BACT|nr:hypothetical protein [Stigmatella ashevillena]MDC0710366.1 hypothetical protein [Stigmatella ashevillena]